jgi:hypothetical protein
LNGPPATPHLIPAIDAGADLDQEVVIISRTFPILDFADARASH